MKSSNLFFNSIIIANAVIIQNTSAVVVVNDNDYQI